MPILCQICYNPMQNRLPMITKSKHGNMFATFIFVGNIRLTPTQNINMEPTTNKLEITVSVRNGSIYLTKSVIALL